MNEIKNKEIDNIPLKVYRKAVEYRTIKKKNTPSPWVEYWNLQPNLRKHNDPKSKVYIASVHAAEEILRGFSRKKAWDIKWIAKNNIPENVLYKPWAPAVVKRAIRVLNAMCEPGNWPGPGSWVARCSMADAFYNPRNCTSILVIARCSLRAKKFSDRVDELTWEKASPYAQTIAAPLKETGIEIRASVAESIAKQYNILCKNDPLLVHVSGGLEGFGRMLARWLLEQNITRPGFRMEPPHGYLWRKFCATFTNGD
jgi:hypothetical protein